MPEYPKRDLRAMYQWFRSEASRPPPAQHSPPAEPQPQQQQQQPAELPEVPEKVAEPPRASPKKLQQLIRDKLAPTTVAHAQVAASPTSGAAMVDRPLNYPFTKGISFVNDGVGYGEVTLEKCHSAGKRSVLQARRTKTGRTELRPAQDEKEKS